MYAQLELPIDFPFTKKEQSNIKTIQKILKYGKIDNTVIYEHGLYFAMITGLIKGKTRASIVKQEKEIPIHNRKEIDITYDDVVSVGSESVENAVPAMVKTSEIPDDKKITKVEILMKQERFEALKKAMNDIGVTGMTVTQVLGCGAQKGAPEYYRGVQMEMQLLPKVQVEMVISKVPVMDVINAARKVLYTGHIGDGKIFVYDVENVVKVRTGEVGYDALQGEDD